MVAARSLVDYKDRRAQHHNRTLIVPRRHAADAVSPFARAHAQVSVGTEVNIVQEGIPDVIPEEACYLGWQDSLRNLASLVEPEINQLRERVANGC